MRLFTFHFPLTRWLAALCFVALIALAACTQNPSYTRNGAGTPAGGQAQATPAGYGPGAGAAAGAGPVKIGRALLDGKLTPVLTDAQQRTLYYSDADTATVINCPGPCLQLWRPLETTARTVQSPPGLPGKLTVVNAPSGVLQVAYNGHPLYTYSRDTGPLQVNGNGLNGKWHVATPDTPAQ